MLRRRSVAAAPARSASETWQVIANLLADTLDRSPNIERADVEDATRHAAGVGRMLVAGGHLERDPITLVAGELQLEIIAVSGDEALSIDENLNPVPGGASADAWTIHLPPCPPLTSVVEDAAEGHEHLSSKPAVSAVAKASRGAQTLDEGALQRWAKGGS